MALKPIINDKVVSEEQNSIPVEGVVLNLKNHIRTLIDRAGVYSKDGTDLWGEAYVDSDGQNNSVDTSETTAVFDTNKYKYNSDPSIITHTIPSGIFSANINSAIGTAMIEKGDDVEYKLKTFIDFSGYNEDVFVVFETSASVNLADFSINDCTLFQIDSTSYLLVTTESDDEIARAKIYATLFYGTNGSNPRLGTYTATSLSTSVSKDIGKKGYYAFVNMPSGGATNATSTYTGTFSNTSDNTAVSMWWNLFANGNSTARIELPSGTLVDSVYAPTNIGVSNNKILTDTSSAELDNPATIRINNNVSNFADRTANTQVFVLTKGNINWVASLASGSSANNTDFINYMSDAGPYPSNIDEDTGWLPINEVVEFPVFSAIPKELLVKIGADTEIRGFSLVAK